MLNKFAQSLRWVQEAKSLPGVGHRLAEKIWEIVESGELRKLHELTSLEETKALEVFTNVWGAGLCAITLPRIYELLGTLAFQKAS